VEIFLPLEAPHRCGDAKAPRLQKELDTLN
jgi:hypothetical protein